jgi:hypothetical protein
MNREQTAPARTGRRADAGAIRLTGRDVLTGAPVRLVEQLLDAFNVQAVYSNDLHQVTIHVTITDATPQTITDLLNDPRTDQATPAQTPAPATKDHFSHLAADTGVHAMAPLRTYASGGRGQEGLRQRRE